MKATTHQVDKLTEICLDLSVHHQKDNGVNYEDLIIAWEIQTGHSLADYRRMDALVFAYHLGYFTRAWGMKP